MWTHGGSRTGEQLLATAQPGAQLHRESVLAKFVWAPVTPTVPLVGCRLGSCVPAVLIWIKARGYRRAYLVPRPDLPVWGLQMRYGAEIAAIGLFAFVA